jgi:tetratricopeptide (TPR) repeat protein
MSDAATILDLESSNSTVQITANTAEDYYRDANVKYYELQDIQGGLSSYDRAIELDLNHALAYSNRGNIKKDNLQDYQGALDDYDRALSLAPNDAVTTTAPCSKISSRITKGRLPTTIAPSNSVPMMPIPITIGRCSSI